MATLCIRSKPGRESSLSQVARRTFTAGVESSFPLMLSLSMSFKEPYERYNTCSSLKTMPAKKSDFRQTPDALRSTVTCTVKKVTLEMFVLSQARQEAKQEPGSFPYSVEEYVLYSISVGFLFLIRMSINEC